MMGAVMGTSQALAAISLMLLAYLPPHGGGRLRQTSARPFGENLGVGRAGGEIYPPLPNCGQFLGFWGVGHGASTLPAVCAQLGGHSRTPSRFPRADEEHITEMAGRERRKWGNGAPPADGVV